ncbi:eukaryotic translation initiation factor 3 subunit C [[Candida] railenensis]|uniref:Eukaryotic translation initiation factor 3 subunit C n=1 Tax=[Candida] railenensis TaxID=45579 RepID=A0A9P0QNQ7_9ASCO|nr:eukaryotic translation initiation factor 3 subunit C [[Candida] railenensis]
MSRFFASGYSSDSSSEEDLVSSSEEELLSSSEELSTDSEFANDSDDDSDEDNNSDSDDSDGERPTGPAYFLKKSFLKGAGGDSDSDSEDEGKRVVKSSKEKLLDEMRSFVDAIATARRSGDWSTVLTEFDRLNRQLIRATQQNITIPNFYIKSLAETDDYITETAANEKESKKKMNAALAKAFNTVKQRVKKQLKEYQQEIELFREQPDLFDKEQPLDDYLKPLEGDETNNQTSTPEIDSQRILSPTFTTLRVISESRGKKNVDRFEQIQALEDLIVKINESSPASTKTFELISSYLMLLSIRFDASSNFLFMPTDQWTKSELEVNSLLDLLNDVSSTYQVSELGSITDDLDIEPVANNQGVKVISGSITSLIERLDDEFTRSLQNSDPHSLDYIERLKDENKIYQLIVRGQLYLELTTPVEVRATEQGESLARITSRRLEHIYYKPDQLITAIEQQVWSNIPESADSQIVSKNASPSELIDSLSQFLSKQSHSVYKKKSVLCTVYYYAVNNKYQEAKALFLDPQLYSQIHKTDSTIQVMYNRALVQLGLSAFRSGFIEESHLTLTEIANTQRLKELLGQGFSTKYPNQATTAEKQKLLPFHMHINLELFECVYMTGTFLLEIPAIAASYDSSNKDNRRKTSIKSFKSKLEFYDKQYFTGPPESIKDHVVHAAKALQKGDWSKSYELLSSIKIWKLFPDNESLLAMMKNQLQVEGLRTYIFTYQSIYSKLSISKLSTIFGLDTVEVYKIVRKMIRGGEIRASLGEVVQEQQEEQEQEQEEKEGNQEEEEDEEQEGEQQEEQVSEAKDEFDDNEVPAEIPNFLVFISKEHQRTRLQELAIVMNEKVGLVTEKNEKTAANGHGRKSQQQVQQQKEQREQKEQEENSRFRYASVNTNNDEFQ